MASKDCHEKRAAAKLLWPILGIAAVLMLAAALVKLSHGSPRTSAVGEISETPRSEVATEVDRPPVAETQAAAVSRGRLAQLPSNSDTNLEQKEVETRATELMRLAMNDDAASLESILKELRNPNRNIRDAALQATIQFGSRDAIPSLNESAQRAEDDSEKKQLLAAIEFLKLPSLTEVLLKERTQNASSASVTSR